MRLSWHRAYALAHQHLGFTPGELATVARTGFEQSFLPLDRKWELLAAVDRELALLGLVREG